MRTRLFLLPIAALALAGCDRITGADQQRALDAEAIGYSCRISLKPPEDCIKENDTLSPTSILFGWKEAERDIKEKAIDPTMGKSALQTPQSPAATAESKHVAEKAAESTPTAKSEKAAAAGEKPAVAAGKPDKGATEKPAGR